MTSPQNEATEPVADLDSVTVNRQGKNILEEVSWRITPGQHWVILGPNGAGKTTLARLLAGREQLTSGSIQLLGQGLGEHEALDLASRVGFASAEVGARISAQETTLQAVLSSAWGQSASFGEGYEQLDEERGKDLLHALGVGDFADRVFASLSEGERRRVFLARALMPDPELLILDEPTAGLDLAGTEILVSALAEIMASPQSPSTILITHELEEIGPGFTHALLLRDGKSVAQGPIDQVLTGENLTAAFGLPLKVGREDGRWWAVAGSN